MSEKQPTPIWRYAIGMFGMALPINMVRSSMALYWIDILGLPAAAYAAVMAVYGVLDAIDNPILGHLSDRTRSRFGRRKPWLIAGAAVLGLALVGFFGAPSGLAGPGLIAWFALFAIMTEAADSMIGANYGSLLPELYTDEAARARANSLRQGFQLAGMMFAIALTPVLTTSVFGTETTTRGFTITAALYSLIAATAIFFMAFSVTENPPPLAEQTPGFFRSILDIVSVKIFWQVGLASAAYLVPLGVALATMQLYVKYSLELPVSYTFGIMGAAVVFAMAGIALWTGVITRYGAPPVWRAGYVFLAVGFIPLYFARNLVEAILAAAIIAVGWSALLATNDLIQSRILDADARATGIHREGIFLAAFGFFGRITGGLTGAGFWLISVMFGYEGQANPGDDPGAAFRFLIGVIPLLIAASGAVLSRTIRIPEAGRD